MSLLLATSGSSGKSTIDPEGVDFDGVSDYLSRSTDLVGNADGKTFTFSAWVWGNSDTVNQTVYNSGSKFYVRVIASLAGTSISVTGVNISGTTILSTTVGAGVIPKDTFSHVLISIDLANTANRHIYVNDVIKTATWATYDNQNIDFTQTSHYVATGDAAYRGRLSHVYLDKTYRNLSIESNRRLFITADRKPANMATLKALNPILYLPMKDATTAHINEGTGGNFTLNGVIARSGRGPNQFNAPYSDLDGTADYLSRTTALNGATAGNAFTFACCFNWDGTTGQKLFEIAAPPNVRFQVAMDGGSPSKLVITGETSAGVTGINASLSTSAIAVGRNYVLVVSCDLSNTANRRITLNGVAQFVTWTTYTNVSIAFNLSNQYVGAQNGGISLWNGRLGNVFFDTKYIDLSNPDNLAKFVTGTGIDAKPADLGANGELPFGTPPLIYLPMYGNNAGKNYGTGGDFTANSAPYVGARGASEFWGNKAVFNASTTYLSKTSALSGVSDGLIVSGCIWFILNASGSGMLMQIAPTSGNVRFAVDASGGVFSFKGASSGGSFVLQCSGGAWSTATQYCLQYCIDLSNSANRFFYLNGTQISSMAYTTYTPIAMNLSSSRTVIGANWNGSTYDTLINGGISELYFTTTYIDFSQEANRLKFRDAFGNPVALLPQIEAGTLPNPAIYMRFDPANQGKNYGTGGDFVKSGTILDGGQL